MNILGLITARGGSKGVPRKNVLPLAGRPLIAWTIDAALASSQLTETLVSTDDAEIATVARRHGAVVPFLRPAELAADDSAHIDVVKHAVRFVTERDGQLPDYVVLLQPTTPFRSSEDIDAGVQLAIDNRADAVVSVCPVEDHPMLAQKIVDGRLNSIMPRPDGYLARQTMPDAYVLNGAIYALRCEPLLQAAQVNAEGALAYVMPRRRSLDIDTPEDFHLAELIAQDRHARKIA